MPWSIRFSRSFALPVEDKHLGHKDDEDPARRMTLNLLTGIVLLLLLIAGFWLMRELDAAKKAQDCLSSGSQRCRKIQTY